MSKEKIKDEVDKMIERFKEAMKEDKGENYLKKLASISRAMNMECLEYISEVERDVWRFPIEKIVKSN